MGGVAHQHDVAGVKELALQSRDLVSTHAFPASAALTLPPLSTLFLEFDPQ